MSATYTQKYESDHGTVKWYMKLDLDEQNIYEAIWPGRNHQRLLLASTEINIGSYDLEGFWANKSFRRGTAEATEAKIRFYQRPGRAKTCELTHRHWLQMGIFMHSEMEAST